MRQSWACSLLALAPLLLCSQANQEKVEVTGTVLNSANGQPVSGAMVQLQGHRAGSGVNVVLRAMSDSTGRFSILVTEGRLTGQLAASHQGFFSDQGLGEAYAEIPHDSTAATLRLTPLGVIRGRVKNPDGEALPGVAIHLIRLKMGEGRRHPDEIAQSLTDDRGEFRLWNIFPGSYFLELTGQSRAVWNMGDLPNLPGEETYGPIYYPAAETQVQAEAIRIGPGETVSADFTAAGRAGYRVSGQLRAPGNFATIRLLRNGGVVGQRVSINRSTGDFQVFDMVPGLYTMLAFAKQGDATWSAEQTFQVQQADVSGLLVALSPPIEVKGSIEFLDGANGDTVTVLALPRSPHYLPSLYPRPLTLRLKSREGEFAMKLAPGSYDFVVKSDRHYPASIQWNGVDVLKDGLTFERGAAPELKVLMQSGTARIQGKVEGAELASAIRVLLIPRNGGPDIRDIYTSATFLISGVPPGEYTAIAVPGGRDAEYRNPVWLQEMAASAVVVMLHEGDNPLLTLRLAPEPRP